MTPTVLAVVVARDGAPWLKRCLAGLGRQRHPRLAVVAVDNGSRDASWQLLASALGHRRVIRLERNVGFPEAVRLALASPVAEKADFILLLHDDTVLAPDTVTRLVDAAQGVEQAGVVGAKVLDAEQPRILREVGLSTDRFGYPHSPLEPDEIDQGQYDSAREVLYVSSAVMLVAREAWRRAGLFDERLDTCHADLDFCWRIRLAGFRVLVDPRAVALHGSVGEAGQRRGAAPERRRYLIERAGLLSLLKNYRALTLLWLLPLYFLQGVVRIAVYALTRRFASAGQVVAAWGWNLRNLRGTWRRRSRSFAVRRARDRDVVRYMAPAGARLRRWVLEASAPLVGTRAGPLEPETDAPQLRRRVTGFLGAHPVAVGWVAAVLLSLVAFRGVLFASDLQGAALPSVPDDAGSLFGEFGSGWRSAGFGGPGGASPALVPLGVASLITLDDPGLFLRLFLSSALILAAVSCYRSLVRRSKDRTASVTGAACYAFSAVAMWAVSEGRLGTVVFIAAVPWIGGRVIEAFSERRERPLPWIVGTGAGIAVTVSFFPSAWIAVAMFLLAATTMPDRGGSRMGGLGLVMGAVVAAAILVFPFTATIVAAGGGAAVEAAGAPRMLALLRLSPGGAPGAGFPAAFLPLAAVLAFAMTEERRRAWRTAVTAGVCLLLAWLAAAGRLPAATSNPIAFLGTAAFLLSALVASALQTLTAGVHRAAFGARQLAVVALGATVVLGLTLQAVQALTGSWAIGEDRVPPAWPVVSTANPGSPFRVLWVGRAGGAAFPAPGGLPDGEASGPPSIRYGVTGRDGRPLSEIGTAAHGPAFARLERLLTELVRGDVRHGGAVLATMGIRYVVSGEHDLPPKVVRALSAQVDLDLVQRAGGLRVFRSSVALPLAWTAAGGPARAAVRAGPLAEVARLVSDPALQSKLTALSPRGAGWWSGVATADPAGVGVVGTPFDERWEVAPPAETFPAFGWAVGFTPPSSGGPVVARFAGQFGRGLELAGLAVLWAAALWITRRGPREA